MKSHDFVIKRSTIGFVLALLFTTGSSATMVAHYRFDGNFKDSTHFRNHGTPKNGASLVEDAPTGTGQSLMLGGSQQHVFVPHHGSLNMTRSMTIAAWIKPWGVGWEGIVAKNPSNGSSNNHVGNYSLRLDRDTNQLHFLHQQGKKDDTAFVRTDQPAAAIIPGRWTHVAVTVAKGGNARFYVNGVLADTKPVASTFGATNTNPLYIGSRADFVTQFNGTIDDLAIFDTGLTVAEINRIKGGNFSAYLNKVIEIPKAVPKTERTPTGIKYTVEAVSSDWQFDLGNGANFQWRLDSGGMGAVFDISQPRPFSSTVRVYIAGFGDGKRILANTNVTSFTVTRSIGDDPPPLSEHEIGPLQSTDEGWIEWSVSEGNSIYSPWFTLVTAGTIEIKRVEVFTPQTKVPQPDPFGIFQIEYTSGKDPSGFDVVWVCVKVDVRIGRTYTLQRSGDLSSWENHPSPWAPPQVNVQQREVWFCPREELDSKSWYYRVVETDNN